MADHNGTPHEVDLIIVGGGAAGGILAGRLAKVDPNLEILLIESGINNRDLPQVVNPALYLSNLVPTSNTATFYEAKASGDLAGRKVVVPVGGCLGGGSSINFMMYTRAQAIDFEDWKAEGWGPKDLLPLLRKTENFHIDDPAIDNGEFHVSRGTYEPMPFVNDWMSTVKSLGYKEAADANNLLEGNAFMRWPKWIHPETGARQDVPHTLLHPIVDAGNAKLKILTESKVLRVIFDENKRAVGVEYIPSKSQQFVNSLMADVDASSSPVVVKARKLVVISAGAIGSPQVLQRSGVGNKLKLSQLGISTVSEVDGVGTNYQDHHLLLSPYFSKAKPEETLDGLLSGRLSPGQAFKQKEISPSTSILGWNGVDTGSKLRPSLEDVKAMGQEVEDLWNRDFRDRPSKPLMLMASLVGFMGDHSTIPAGQYFTTGCYTAYPYSRGSVHITGNSVDDPIEFDVGILNHPADVAKLVWAYKKQREIARRLEHYAGALEVAHPKFPEASKASFAYVDGKDKEQTNGTCAVSGAVSSIGFTDGSSGTNGHSRKLRDIEYSKEDDAAIEQFVRENVQTTWHGLGTCAMKPLEEGGTVDKDLDVYGVEGLKVADLSIPPTNIGGNTYSTAMLIGEKAAVIIAKELGFNYVV